MIFCNYCGLALADDVAVCPRCRAIQRSAPQYVNPQAANQQYVNQQYAYQQPQNRQSAAPRYQQPVQPQYQQPVPQYQQPAPQYQQPAPQYQQPAPQYQQPAAPQYQQPTAQQYQQPAAPQPQQPAEPKHEQPEEPRYEQPTEPQYEQPVRPQYQPPAAPQYQPSSAPVGQLKTNKGLLKYILLSAITFGIYGLVVMSSVSSSINITASRYDGRSTMHYCLLCFLIGPLTCGIATLVWFHRISNRIGNELRRRNIDYSFSAGHFWLWNILGSMILVGPFIYYHKLFKSTNLICAHYNVNG